MLTDKFKKSTRSNPSGNCVMVKRRKDGNVEVRDSKDPSDERFLIFTPAEWGAFMAGAKDGDFDLPEKIALPEEITDAEYEQYRRAWEESR